MQAGIGSIADFANEYNQVKFAIKQEINKLQTVMLVKVIAVHDTDDVTPVGFVDVQPLVKQMDGNRDPHDHGIIYGIPYLRLQGGKDAIIILPKVGDNGVCLFCSRDISKVKTAKDYAEPVSFRKYDFSDGLYLGGFLNGDPEQWVQFLEEGIKIHTPNKVFIEAGNMDINVDNTININASQCNINANTAFNGTLTSNGKNISNSHTHNNAGGTGTSGDVV